MRVRRPQKKTKKELRRKRSKFVVISLLLIVIFVSFIWIMNNEYFKISRISLSGNKTILDMDIQQIINENLYSEIFFVLPRNNVLLTNTKHIERDIKNAFPKIYDAEVIVENGSELVVSVNEREPHSLWCKNKNYISNFDEECYFADQRGYIYTHAPYFSGGVFEKIYTTNELLKIGEQILDKDEFIDFFKFIVFLDDNFGVTVDYVFLNEHNETQIYINSFLNKNLIYKPYIIYHTNDDYEIVGRNMSLMIEHDLFKKDYENKSEKLKFIDLRIADQIRYKFMTDEEYLEMLEEKKTEIKEEFETEIVE